MIDVGQFAKPVEPNGEFRFAIGDKSEVAKTLREIADRVECGQILIQKVQGGQVASHDDYYLQALFIEFAERETGPAAEG